ncbi:MAG: DUF4446 family protein [Lachnospiraceae bacterium]|nr:DUF4446 family protein [Lachnospiraceae bacterium]
MNTNLLDSLGLVGFDLSYIIIALLVLLLAAIVIAVIALSKYRKLEKKYMTFMGGRDALSLEEQLLDILQMEKDNKNLIEDNRIDIQILNKKMGNTYQKLGILKYDAFKEMGGRLSFALALLNEKNDGFVINTVHHPESSYSYVKSIRDGKCNIELSEEETKALQKALGKVDK